VLTYFQALDVTNPDFIANYYRNVHVNGSAYFGNVLAMRALDFEKEWDGLGKPVDREQWYDRPSSHSSTVAC
jgi:predicted metalloendopeptidase